MLLKSFREGLPAFQRREEVLELIASNQVVLLSGETGCGKTTQVPQFILDDAAARNVPARVVCSQPRRLSAIGVAERVASEWGRPVGSTVGYHIRLGKAVLE